MMLPDTNPQDPLLPLAAPAEVPPQATVTETIAPVDDATAAAGPAAEPQAAEQAEPEAPAQPALEAEPTPQAEAETAADAQAPGDADAAPGPAVDAAPAAPAAPELSPAACAARLAELFPALFGAGRALPVKLRIQADIQQRAPGVFSRKALSHFLHRHTTSTAYIRTLAQATQRFDLDGQPAGELDEEHRAAAAVELDRRRGIVEAKRAAEREAQREAARAAEAQRREQAADHAVEDAERRERAALLRAFEASTLAHVNFCALTGIGEEELEQQLTLARQEQAAHGAQRRPDDRAQRPADARPDARPPRQAPGGRPPQGRRDALPPRRGPGKPPGPRQP